jgi:hypothetical protein
MKQHRFRPSLYVLLLLALLPACARPTAQHRNDQLLTEIKAILFREEEAVRAVPMKYRDVFGRENLLRALTEREKLRAPTVEMVGYLNASNIRYREIANKFDELSRLSLDERFREYAAAQARLFAKDAEYRTLSKDRISLVLDESIKDVETLSARLERVDEQIGQIHAERARLQARSDAFVDRSQRVQ